MALVDDLKKRNRRAIAKAITIMEHDQTEARRLLKTIFPETGGSAIIGITGPAGAGKSTLISKTAVLMHKMRTRPAILAVDPTSHITGGAILGDRVRMTESAGSKIYMRSMASRGATGAVSRHLQNSIRVLEYAGFDPIFVESVGAGQTEVDISRIADITVVAFNPHTGDSIQAIKAGITEIGDIYLVNKCDLDGANRLYDSVVDYIGTSQNTPLVLKTSAKTGEGIKDLASSLKKMMRDKVESRKARDDSRLEYELRDIILNGVKDKVDGMLESDRTYASCLKRLQSRKIDPYDAADRVIKKLGV